MSKRKISQATLAEQRAGQAAVQRRRPSPDKPKRGGKGRSKEVTPEVTPEAEAGMDASTDGPVEMETTIEDFNDVKERVEDNDSLNDILGG